MARPKIENPKNKKISARLYEEEYGMLLSIQSVTGEDFSEIMRKAVRSYNDILRNNGSSRVEDKN